MTASGSVPGKEAAKFLANRRLHTGPEGDKRYEMLFVYYDFIPAYGLQLVAGRSFDRSRPTDAYGLVLNKTAVRQFGFTSSEAAIGKKCCWKPIRAGQMRSSGSSKTITSSPWNNLQAHHSLYRPRLPLDSFGLLFRTLQRHRDSAIGGRGRTHLERVLPQSSLDYFFLDAFYDQQYRQDRRFGRTFLIFSSLAIFIACLGLLGLTAYSTARRAKETSIRKVLGATVAGIVSLLAWDTLKLVLLTGLVAVPVSLYVTTQWLAGYAFRIQLRVGYWVLPLALLTGIALLTIGWLTVRAALANPAKTLRNE